MMTRFLAATTLAASLAACSMVPDYFRPAVEAPPAWDSRKDAAPLWPDAAWWRGFNSSELDRLIASGQASNTDLRAALARIRQAEAQARISGAALYPTLGIDAGASRTRQGRGSVTASTGISNIGNNTRSDHVIRNSYSGNLAVGYQLDLFGANAATADAALARLESSRFDREAVAITLHADIAANYFTLLGLRDRIRLANETLRIAEDVLEVLERQRAAGASTDFEVAQQRSAVATQRATVAGLQQQERVTLDALAVLLGRPPQGFQVEANSLNAVNLPQVVAGLPSELLLRRPDLRRAESDLIAANFDIGAARAARFPSLALTARAGTQSTTTGMLLDPTTMVYSIASSLTAPIFEGGRLEGQEDLSRARNQELVETYRGAILTAFRDTEDALSATAITAQQYLHAQEAFDQAREAYRIVESRFRAGTVDFINLLDAQRSVFAANDTLVQAYLSRFTAIIDLYEALGGGWDGSLVELPRN